MRSGAYRPSRIRALYRTVGHIERNYALFRKAVHELADEGKLVRVKGGRWAPAEEAGFVEGIFKSRRNGGGLVRTGDGIVIAVERHRTKGALSGDTVIVKSYPSAGKREAIQGEIIKITRRANRPVVGIFHQRGGIAFVSPTGSQHHRDIYLKKSVAEPVITGEELASQVREGDHVVVELFEDRMGWPGSLKGRIVEILGGPETPGIDMIGLLRRYSISIEFPREVVEEVDALPDELTKEDLKGRLDLRELFVLTIDPEDARDFDDALSLEILPDGAYRLGVHIADVAHYVREGNSLDREARERGTSIYLVDRAVPMIPEKLSGDLCSLRPGEDRLTKTVFAEVGSDGSLKRYEILSTVIRSGARLNYHEAQEIVERLEKNPADDIGRTLQGLLAVTDLLGKRRRERGGLDFDVPEVEVILNEKGFPQNIRKARRLRTHEMVEDAMLLANTIIAEHLRTMGAPLLFRVHEPPAPEDIKRFGEVVKSLGYHFTTRKAHDKGYIQGFLKKIRGSRLEGILNYLFLRSLKRARYTEKHDEHYGLGLETYTHFTSPIRRYPDLYIHRLLDRCTGYAGKKTWQDVDRKELEVLAENLTEREQIANEIERESVKIMQVQFMAERIGEVFTGTIVGPLSIGFFVELEQFFVEGLVHVSSLRDDYYMFDESRMLLKGRSKGRVFRIGDRVRVRVARVDVDELLIDFELIEVL